MKNINIIYVVALVMAFLLYTLYMQVKSDAAFFYGFAENKETEINHPNDVLVEKIYVSSGEKVKKGDLLLIVKNATLPIKINELELEKRVIFANVSQDVNKIKYKLSELRFEKLNKLNEIDASINELNKEIELNNALYVGLKSFNHISITSKSPKELEVDFLVNKLNSVARMYNQEIAYQEELLGNIEKPSKIKKNIIEGKINHYRTKEEQLSIYAPSDGIVGSILCKENENIKAFRTLLSFYQVNPTLVKGFVHESLLLQVKEGNRLNVTSSMHKDHKLIGTVIGLGSRIVEIPARLRKMAEIKSYGREILIKISPDNKFLQKEKVMLNLVNINKESFLTALLSKTRMIND